MKNIIFVFLLIIIMLFSVSCGNNTDEPQIESSLEESRIIDSSATMAVPDSEESIELSQPEISLSGEISVIVLGDSISRGYGLKNIEKQRFSAIIEKELKKSIAQVNMTNYGVDGMTGAQLAEMLKNNPPKELANADYILISIGGNNVLRGLASLKGLHNLYAEIEPQIFLDYFKFLTSKTEEEKQTYDYARETLNMIFKSANNAFESREYKNLVEKARNNLATEIPLILSSIRKVNPNVEIIIQTIYNPYKGMELRLKSVETSLNLHKFGNMAVLPLNEVIINMAESQGYRVAPVYEGFELSSQQLTNAGFDLLRGVFGVDPHPNYAGHTLISKIYMEMISEE